MAELPTSFGLTERPRSDGKVDIIGKDDSGRDYTVRTTSGPEVTPGDIDAIAAGDRERTTAREFVSGLIREKERRDAAQEDHFGEEMAEAAQEVVGRAKTRRGPGVNLPETTGASRAFRRGWEAAAQGKLWWQVQEEARRNGRFEEN